MDAINNDILSASDFPRKIYGYPNRIICGQAVLILVHSRFEDAFFYAIHPYSEAGFNKNFSDTTIHVHMTREFIDQHFVYIEKNSEHDNLPLNTKHRLYIIEDSPASTMHIPYKNGFISEAIPACGHKMPIDRYPLMQQFEAKDPYISPSTRWIVLPGDENLINKYYNEFKSRQQTHQSVNEMIAEINAVRQAEYKKKKAKIDKKQNKEDKREKYRKKEEDPNGHTSPVAVTRHLGYGTLFMVLLISYGLLYSYLKANYEMYELLLFVPLISALYMLYVYASYLNVRHIMMTKFGFIYGVTIIMLTNNVIYGVLGYIGMYLFATGLSANPRLLATLNLITDIIMMTCITFACLFYSGLREFYGTQMDKAQVIAYCAGPSLVFIIHVIVIDMYNDYYEPLMWFLNGRAFNKTFRVLSLILGFALLVCSATINRNFLNRFVEAMGLILLALIILKLKYRKKMIKL